MDCAFVGRLGSNFGDRSFVDCGIQERRKGGSRVFSWAMAGKKRSNGCGVKGSFALPCVVRQAPFEWAESEMDVQSAEFMNKQTRMARVIIALAWANCSSSPSSKRQAQRRALRLSMVVRGMSTRSRVAR